MTELRTLIGILRQQPWSLWWIQFRRFARIEIRRNLFTRRAWWIYFLAFVPAVIILIHLLVDSHPSSSMTEDTNILADSGEAIRPSGLHIYFCLRRPCTLQTDDRINRDYMSAGAQGSVVATIIGDLCNVHTIHAHANDSRPESWATHDYESAGRLVFLHRRR